MSPTCFLELWELHLDLSVLLALPFLRCGPEAAWKGLFPLAFQN